MGRHQRHFGRSGKRWSRPPFVTRRTGLPCTATTPSRSIPNCAGLAGRGVALRNSSAVFCGVGIQMVSMSGLSTLQRVPEPRQLFGESFNRWILVRPNDWLRAVRPYIHLNVKVAQATHESPFSPRGRRVGEEGETVMTFMIWGVSTCHDR